MVNCTQFTIYTLPFLFPYQLCDIWIEGGVNLKKCTYDIGYQPKIWGDLQRFGTSHI